MKSSSGRVEGDVGLEEVQFVKVDLWVTILIAILIARATVERNEHQTNQDEIAPAAPEQSAVSGAQISSTKHPHYLSELSHANEDHHLIFTLHIRFLLSGQYIKRLFVVPLTSYSFSHLGQHERTTKTVLKRQRFNRRFHPRLYVPLYVRPPKVLHAIEVWWTEFLWAVTVSHPVSKSIKHQCCQLCD